jgi:hypothetical protein
MPRGFDSASADSQRSFAADENCRPGVRSTAPAMTEEKSLEIADDREPISPQRQDPTYVATDMLSSTFDARIRS